MGFENGMRADEVPGEAALFIMKADSPVESRDGFTEPCDALDTPDCVFVEDVIVAEPDSKGRWRKGIRW